MPVLLVVHHTASPTLDLLLERVLAGTADEAVEGVEVRVHPALSATASDLLAADAVLLGTPANAGYMSGALKVFFDGVYYPCLRATRGLPYGLFVHGNDDVGGAVRSVETLARGMGWTAALPPVGVTGPVDAGVRERLYELGATLAVTAAERGSGTLR